MSTEAFEMLQLRGRLAEALIERQEARREVDRLRRRVDELEEQDRRLRDLLERLGSGT